MDAYNAWHSNFSSVIAAPDYINSFIIDIELLAIGMCINLSTVTIIEFFTSTTINKTLFLFHLNAPVRIRCYL